MKKALAILLTLSLTAAAAVLPAGASEKGRRYYGDFIRQYYDGAEPAGYDAEIFVYNEVYYHTADGATDWALVEADSGIHLEVETTDVFFGRAFANNDIAVPFTYGYGIYDAALERFFDFGEIADSSRYPDLQEVLDARHIGVKIGTPQFGENLRYTNAFYSLAEQFAAGRQISAEQTVRSYDELYYHKTDGVADWALVQGEFWFRYPYGSVYEVIDNRVFRAEGIGIPFGNTYAVYHAAAGRFYELRSALVNPEVKISRLFPGLAEVLDELNLGEKIGDINQNGALDIGDATELQRCLAEYRDYPAADGVEADGCRNIGDVSVQYLSDVNGDGKRDISDVTAAQRKLTIKK